MEEGGTSAEVEQETVRAVVEAYAAGQLFQTLEAFVKGGRPLKGGVGLPGAITRLQEPGRARRRKWFRSTPCLSPNSAPTTSAAVRSDTARG